MSSSFPGVPLESDADSATARIRALLATLNRRRKLIAIGFALLLPPSVAVSLLLPPTYRASVRLQLETAPAALRFGGDVFPQPVGRDRISALTALTLSDRVLRRVEEQLGATAPPARSGIRGWLFPDAPSSPETLQQARIQGLRDSLQVGEAGGGSVFVITATLGAPVAAAALANAVAEALMSHERERLREAARTAVSWLDQKVLEQRDVVHRREEALMAALRRAPKSAGPGGAGGRGVVGELAIARVELLSLEENLAELRRRGPSASDTNATALRARLDEAALALEEARLRYTPENPEIRRLESVVAALQESLQQRTPSEAPLPTGGEELEGRRARLAARVRALEREIAASGQPEDLEAATNVQRVERELLLEREVLSSLSQRLDEARLNSEAVTTELQILDRAIPPARPSSPNRSLALAASLAVSLGFGLALGLGAEALRNGVYSPLEASRVFDCPYLGSIPELPGRARALLLPVITDSPAAESYRLIRTALMRTPVGEYPSVFLVTSGVAGEGKTTVAANLAAAFTFARRRVLLVDADLRRPRVDRLLAAARAPGLSNLLVGEKELAEVVQRPLGVPFDVLTSGDAPAHPSDLLSSPAFPMLLEITHSVYDVVIIDSPVLLAVSDALLLSSYVRNVLLVHRPGATDRRACLEATRRLERAGVHKLGVVLNAVDRRDFESYPRYLESPYLQHSETARDPKREARKSNS
jgi:capsular exopolysaccharide synthesis family protein